MIYYLVMLSKVMLFDFL